MKQTSLMDSFLKRQLNSTSTKIDQDPKTKEHKTSDKREAESNTTPREKIKVPPE